DWPRLEVVRKPKNDSSLYFGPYTSSYKLRSLLDAINKVLPLRTCSDNIFYNRQRPCLEHQIGRCCAPCCLQVSREEYKSWIKQAISILEGKVESVVAYLEGLMDKAAGELRFEDAAKYRDKIEILKEYSEQGGLRSDDEARDIFGIYREGSLLALSVLIYRRGRLVDSFSYTFEHAALPDEEILLDALTQYYTVEKEVPKEILLPLEVKEAEPLIALLKKRCGRKPVFLVPKRGLKKRLIELANLNAREKFITTFYQERNYAEIAKELQEAFSLSQCPRRIEAVDISHFQGSNISGAVVSFYEGQPDKERYRLFNIRGLSEQDDFAAISEVIKRHLTRCIRENFLPDLLLIDGGKNQLNAAKKSAEELNVEIDIIALAKARSSSKKPERVFLPSRDEPLPLSLSKPSSKLLIKIRDEVHRFVINHHRKRQFKSSLAEEASY
ncbi:MAG: excinuclease ABC subunit UvrC, partial [Candidatus Dadabacteria bacterium]